MEKKASVKKMIFSILLVLSIMVLILGLYFYFLMTYSKLTEQRGIILTTEKLPIYLKNHQFVKELPKNTEIKLTVGKNEYIISKGEVEQILNETKNAKQEMEEVDIDIEIPEEYVKRIGEVGLCQTAGEIVENKDAKIETNLSESELLWKYKNLIKYKNCLIS